MTRKWKVEEERELLHLYGQGSSIEALAEKYKRTPEAIRMKLKRLGIDIFASKVDITGSLSIPKELPSLEEVLKILAGAINKACDAGLGRTELQRLAVIADLYKAYADGLERYVRYTQIEKKLLEIDKKYAELAKKAQNI